MSKIIVSADQSSLEPRIFAHCSGSETLRATYRTGLDLYSVIAIDVLGVKGYSADPNHPDYLGAKNKAVRQETKIFTLQVPYNASSGQVAVSMGYYTKSGKLDFKRAQELIDRYLNAFPELRTYMNTCKYNAMYKGYVTNEYGRRKDLSNAKALVAQYGEILLEKRYAEAMDLMPQRRNLKGMLNAACNFPIQSTAADLINKCAIDTARAFKAEQLDATLRLNVHDELVVIADSTIADRVCELMKFHMTQNSFAKRLSIPLEVTPIIGHNLAEVK